MSKTGRMEAGNVDEAPAGWHWGGKAAVAAIMGGGEEERQPVKKDYRDQGAWDCYTWGGSERTRFLFSDSLEVGGYLYAGHFEGHISEERTAAQLAVQLQTYYFAGIVCVAN